MRTKLFLYASVGFLALGATSCDEDNDQLLDIDPGDEQLLVASNTSSKLVKIQTDELDEVDIVEIGVPYADGDGIGLRGGDLFVANRSDNRLQLLDDVFDKERESVARVEASYDENISNQRGVAVNRELSGARVAVASAGNDANGNVNRIYLFDGTRSDIELLAVVRVPFQLWGLEWDGDRLLAVMDQTDSVAVFEDFDDASSTDGEMVRQPDFKFRVAGLTRTHGIAFNSDDDILFLTDIGEASSDSDGALHVVPNWTGAARQAARRDGVLALDRQVRIAGSSTFLGNPVDVAYDEDNNNAWVAERARDGGRVLAFKMSDISDFLGQTIARELIFNQPVPGASSVEYKR